ncbi:MAG: hypothetical protein R3A50_02355 [Saprospiraceae bacterium]|nr:hypothetical protein [Saprospiraceae bacterium]
MALPIVLAAKGLIIIGKALATKAAAAKAVGYLLFKSISVYGISATIATTLAVGTVVGGVAWTYDRIKDLKAAFKALENNDLESALGKFAMLFNSINGIDIDDFADTIQSTLLHLHVPSHRAHEVHNLICEYGVQIRTIAHQLK